MMLRKIALIAVPLMLLASCSHSQYESSTVVSRQVVREADSTSKPPPFVHCVFFTLKPELTDDQIEEFIRDCYLLKQIPSVRKLDAGRRDERMQRDVNVTDYQVGLIAYFDDKAGYDLYSNHPVHQKLLAKHKDHWAQVRVFDFDARQ